MPPMNMNEMMRTMREIKAEIEILLRMNDLTPADSEVLREQLKEVGRLRGKWDAIRKGGTP
jgi:hypothetical protein